MEGSLARAKLQFIAIFQMLSSNRQQTGTGNLWHENSDYGIAHQAMLRRKQETSEIRAQLR